MRRKGKGKGKGKEEEVEVKLVSDYLSDRVQVKLDCQQAAKY